MRRLLLLVAVLIPFSAARADALTIRDIIDLTRAGLGEDVLLALIEVDHPVFNIDTATLKSLKEAGVSERVIVAVVRSGRTGPSVEEASAPPAQAESEPDPKPQVIVIDHHDAAPQVREVVVPYAVPVYVPVVPRRHLNTERVFDTRTTTSTIIDGERTRERPAPPVYWGGSLRPDAWQPTPQAPPRQPIRK